MNKLVLNPIIDRISFMHGKKLIKSTKHAHNWIKLDTDDLMRRRIYKACKAIIV